MDQRCDTIEPKGAFLDLGELLRRHPELRIEQDDYNINVTANYGVALSAPETLRLYDSHPAAGFPAHLYFHVPLCAYVCAFCSYVKELAPRHGREEALDEWTELLVRESEAYLAHAPWVSTARVESLYVGGGTGALLGPRRLARLMEHVRARYRLSDDCEATLEGNPENFERAALREYLEAGFNRFSVGVQSFRDEVTRFTGRRHDGADSLRAIDELRLAGRPFNVDLMFGLPRQSPESVAQDVALLVERGVPTITIYRLRNADRHRMGIGNRASWNVPAVRERLHAAGAFPPLEATYEMRAAAMRLLLEHRYRPSPCGWWNAPGTYPDGNIPRVSRNKWQRYDTMIAYGPGAYGWITDGGAEALQTHNETDIGAYARAVRDGGRRPLASGRLLRGNEALGSALGFAFKANQPIDVRGFRERFGVELLEDEPCRGVIEELARGGLAELSGDGSAIVPTLDGEALHEEIITVYFHGRIGGYRGEVCRR